jgi:Asp-tRNA(Asn)/Glu-tRNA(Gln) amidotransferase A subunit family amidase
VQRLQAAGAVLVGSLNMDEYAYGFTTENTHYGPCHNPHDLTRIAGGSSGGSGAAVAAGQVPVALGSDTNGSIRVPSSLCGVWGLKPTFGRLSRRGSYPFVHSVDHLGPFADSVERLAATYDALQSPDPLDAGCHATLSSPRCRRWSQGVERPCASVCWAATFTTTPRTRARSGQAAARALDVIEMVEWPDPGHGPRGGLHHQRQRRRRAAPGRPAHARG